MATEQARLTAWGISGRVGSAFRLFMQIRLLVAAITLLLLPRAQRTLIALLLVLCVAALAFIAAHYWEKIIPWLLEHPTLVAAEVGVSFAVLGLGGAVGPFFLSTVITSAVAGLLYRWRGMLAVASLQMLFYFAVLSMHSGPRYSGDLTFQAVFGQPLYYPLVGFAGMALRRLIDEQVAQEERRRRAEVLFAATEERTRLAREMHDSLAKTLRGIALLASALPLWVSRDPARAVEEAHKIAAATEIASREARSLLDELRDETAVLPLPQAVKSAAIAWEQATGITTICEVDEAADLPLRIRYEALAMLGETLANIERHAEARTVTILLAVEQESVGLVIRDDGKGFELSHITDLARKGHYGIIGIRERAQRVGGSMTLRSEPGAGTTVALLLPAVENQLAEAS